MYYFIYGRRKVAVARYLMICLVLLSLFNIFGLWLPFFENFCFAFLIRKRLSWLLFGSNFEPILLRLGSDFDLLTKTFEIRQPAWLHEFYRYDISEKGETKSFSKILKFTYEQVNDFRIYILYK